MKYVCTSLLLLHLPILLYYIYDEATVHDVALSIIYMQGSKSISDSGIRLEVSSEHNSSKVDLEIHKQEMPQSDEDMTNSVT